MRKNVLVALVLMTIAGCSDPAASLLKSGSEVAFFLEGKELVPIEAADGPTYTPMGDRGVVVKDHASGEEGSPDRMVRVNVTTGRHAGESVTVPRQYLRPK